MLKKPVVLVIMDGWGVAPPSRANALSQAKTPVWDKLLATYPSLTLQAAGESVGLPWGEMGNSEVGHLNLGAGKIIYQDLPRINKAIVDNTFYANKALKEAVRQVKKKNSDFHLMGLVSTGGVHSALDHLYALLEFCVKEGLKKVYIHAFLDGRDTPPKAGENFIEKLSVKMEELKVGQIATISGRFYAMDRDNHWDRIEKAYLAMTQGKTAKKAPHALEAIKESYKNNIFDEEFVPTIITDNKGEPLATVKEEDALIFFNYRSDRAREMTKAFVLPGFEKFPREKYLKNLFFVTMTEYESNLPVVVAFPPEKISEPLAKVVADNKLNQLHIAETEKYAHVTFFFNGGREEPFLNENRILVPSPSVSSYDQKPEMSARTLTDKLIKEINTGKYAFVVVNYANADMVGHTGIFPAIVKAIETVDECLGELIDCVLGVNGALILTADHGNAEEKIDLQTGFLIKEHSSNPVPLLIIGQEWQNHPSALSLGSDLSSLTPFGLLSDVAPTVLELMGLPKPKEMTGQSLLKYIKH
ncbi:MAG: 2,3-bisphosphoglycerate-independent phosphoglycerate mutase [Patescibacteria group bacterium]